jgi:hypothetical protein
MARHDDDDDAFDERGVLKDGRSTRVRLMMRDGDGLTELQRAVLADSEARRAARGLVELELTDGATVDVPPWKAAVVRAARYGLFDDGTMSLHRPGPRYAADQAATDARDKAYADSKRELQDAWRQPLSDAAANGGFGSQQGADIPAGARDAAPAMDAREEAYRQYCDELVNAWRGRK